MGFLLQDLPLPPPHTVSGDVLSVHAALSPASSAHVSKSPLVSSCCIFHGTQTLHQAGQEPQQCPPASRQALSTGCTSGTPGISLALDSISSESLASPAPAACLEIPKWKGDWRTENWAEVQDTHLWSCCHTNLSPKPGVCFLLLYPK